MGRKLIYLVRHGETELNAQGIRQGPDGPLSDKGRRQASETAREFPKHKGRPQVIIASPWERAKETAEIIAKQLEMKIEYSDLLVERKNPSEIIGRSGADPEVRRIVDLIDKSFHDDNLRYSDEENFTDLKERAQRLLEFIKSRPEQRIMLVSHSIFIKMVISYMVHGDKLNASLYNTLSFFNPLNNAGMTIVEYIPRWFKKGEWKIIAWNNKA